MAGQVVDEKKKKVVIDAAIVVVAIVVAALEAVVELVRWPTCCKKERPASFSSFGHARPSLGRANFCSDPSRFRPPFLQKHKVS